MTTTKKLPLIFSLVLTFFFSISLHAQTIRYVTTTGAGTKTGDSWANASDDLQLMINNSAVNDQVWVKKGTFKPKYTIDGYPVNITASYPYERWASFNIKSGVKIYGGFLGTETMLSQRVVGDRTTLSGDIKDNDYYYQWYLGSQKIYNFFDNAYILVNALNCSSATVFDGFKVKNGNNERETNPNLINPSGFPFNGCFISNVDGAGMSIYNSNLSIKNCTFEDNISLRYGAVGIFQNSNPTIENCTFQNNKSIQFAHAYGYTDNRGCALACKDATASVKNCVFRFNKGYLGTAVFLDNAPSSSRFENCTFLDNKNLYFGTQMPTIYCTNSNTTFYNCTVNISSFQSNDGRPFVNDGGMPKLRNCILWSTQNGAGVTSSGNSADIQNCIVIGGYPGANNSSRDPNFLYSNGIPYLGACSPAYNTGTNIDAPTTDIDGNPIFGGTRDMGAYESQTNLASTQSTVTIAANPGTTVAWNNPLTFTATMSPVVANATYQWLLNGQEIAGANAVTYTNAQIATGDVVACFLNLSATCRVKSNDLTMSVTCANTKLFVKPNATGLGDGSSWANAANLSSALNNSCGVKEFWLMSGVHRPTLDATGKVPTDGRLRTFLLKNGMKIYGGFSGTETLLTQRNSSANVTILSGDIAGNDVYGANFAFSNMDENAYHVLLTVNTNNTTLVDGIMISGANPNVASTQVVDGKTIKNNYGSLYSNNSQVVVNNCILSNNNGTYAAVFYNDGNAAITATNCTVVNNLATIGSIMMNEFGGGGTFTNCVFTENKTTVGPSMQNYLGVSTLINCIFNNNVAPFNMAKSMHNISSTTTIFNTTFSENNTVSSFILSETGSTVNVKNSILWSNQTSNNILSGNVNITNSVVKGATIYAGVGNKNLNPTFTNPTNPAGTDATWRTADDGLQLAMCSHAYDVGTNTGAPTTDILGAPTVGGTKDAGAYELQQTFSTVTPSVSVFLNAVNTTINEGDMFTFYALIQGIQYSSSVQYQWYVNNVLVSTVSQTSQFGVTYGSNTFKDGDKIKVVATVINIPSGVCVFPNLATSTEYTMTVICNRLYVKPTATGTGDGSSWANAMGGLQAAFDKSTCTLTEIWVANGIYKPTKDHTLNPAPSNPRTKTFLLKSGVRLYGGFVGTETDLSQRPSLLGGGGTILSGDLNGDDVVTGIGSGLSFLNIGDNSYHVVASVNDNSNNSVFDGFIVKGGSADVNTTFTINGTAVNSQDGGALFCKGSKLNISNCTFTENYAINGAGIYNTSSTNRIEKCNIFRNLANFGGGAHDYISNTTYKDVVFTENKALIGGGFYTVNSSLNMSECLIVSNTASNNAGGVFTSGVTSGKMSNCTLFGNTIPSVFNGNLFVNNSSSNATVLSNCIIASGSTAASSITPISINNSVIGYVASGTQYTNTPAHQNTTAAPNFKNAANPIGPDGLWRTADDGLQIDCGSSAFNLGSSANISATDILGASRNQQGNVDAGAYENIYTLNSAAPTLTIGASPSTTIVPNQPITLIANTTNISPNAVYQWTLNGSVVGTNSKTYTTNTIAAASTVSVTVTDNNACATNTPLTSSTAIDISCGTLTRLHVKPSATGTGDGSSWANAMGDLQLAINNPCNITEIWVMKGGYKPTLDVNGLVPSDPRAKTFLLKSGIRLYGGFQGTETDPSQRVLVRSLGGSTMLNGDLDGDSSGSGSGTNFTISNNNNDAYHVVTSVKDDVSTTFDGFTIVMGNANSNTTYTAEGETLTNLSGGAIYNHKSSTQYTNIFAVWNSATNGAVFANEGTSNTSLTNLIAQSNFGTSVGGVIFNSNAPLFFCRNAIIHGNYSQTNGGVIHSQNSTTYYTNVTIVNNYANVKTLIHSESGFMGIQNALIWGNTNVTDVHSGNTAFTVSFLNSCIQGGAYTSNENNGNDPLFVNINIPAGNDGTWGTADDGLRLTCGSPAFNTGFGSVSIPDIFDSATFGSAKDRGAIEMQTDIFSYAPTLTIATDKTNVQPFEPFTLTATLTGAKTPPSDYTFDVSTQGYTLSPTNTFTTSFSYGPYNGLGVGVNLLTRVGCTDNINIANSNNVTIDVACNSNGNIVYVKPTASGTGDGSSWANATSDLQSVLNSNTNNFCNRKEIWVAAGKYLPTLNANGAVPTNPREKVFTIPNGYKLYGGFLGNETSLSQRDPLTNKTILSGDLASNDIYQAGNVFSNAENTHHVVTSTGSSVNTILDGFNIVGGNADEIGAQGQGAMLLTNSTMKIKRCTFNYNRATQGAALYITGSSPDISDTQFDVNLATEEGGVMYSSASNPILTNCSSNFNAAYIGGAFYYTNNSLGTITNCVFESNYANERGGAIYLDASSPTISKCIFYKNRVINGEGGGLFVKTSSPMISKCVFEENQSLVLEGAAIFSLDATPTFSNCVFYKNSSNYGGAIVNKGNTNNTTILGCTFWANVSNQSLGDDVGGLGGATIANTILWSSNNSLDGAAGNNINYSAVKSTTAGTGNVNSDVFFKDENNPKGADNQWLTADDGLVTATCSAAYNSGTNTGAPSDDILDVSRPQFGTVDMGAYESTLLPSTYTPTVTISVPNTSANFGDNVTFTASHSGSIPAGVTVNYQWSISGILANTNSATFSTTNLYNQDVVRCEINVVKNGVNCPLTLTAISNDITMDVTCPTQIIYVKPGGTGHGYSWADAMGSLDNAINNNCGISEIWVASGTYKPSSYVSSIANNPRERTFYLKNGNKFYGGFAGTETSLSQRNIQANATILSGDFEDDDVVTTNQYGQSTFSNYDENAYHVVLSVNDAALTSLDGFTIKGGNAVPFNGNNSTTVEGEIIYNNAGAVYIKNATNFKIDNCVVRENYSSAYGAGVFAENSTLDINKSFFIKNKAQQLGGGMQTWNGALTLTNSIFTKNEAGQGGGGYLFNATMNNCTFANNLGSYSEIYLEGNATINNSIIWNSLTPSNIISYSNVQPVFNNNCMSVNYGGNNNVAGNPQFVNSALPEGADGIFGTSDDGFALACNSQARDIADNSVAPTLDIAGNAVYNVQRDAGAYERQNNDGCLIFNANINCQAVTIQNVSGNRWYNVFINSELAASINPNGQNLGNLTFNVGATGVNIVNGTYYFGRGVQVTTTTAPTADYSMRIYYKDAELTQFNTYSGQNADRSFLSMAWKSGLPYYTAQTCQWLNYSGSSFGTVPNGQIASQDYGLNNDGFYLQFNLDHFTIFAPTTAGSVLPLKLLDFSGKNISPTENLLEWKTAEEKNVSHFDIERASQQGGELRWEKIGKVDALNNVQGGLYSFRDQLLIGNSFYYRLKVIDNDGRFEYSEIVFIENKKDKNVAIYPNPTRDILNISTDNYEQPFILLNSIGQTILQGDFLEKSINLQNLPSGFYYLKIGIESYKVVKK